MSPVPVIAACTAAAALRVLWHACRQTLKPSIPCVQRQRRCLRQPARRQRQQRPGRQQHLGRQRDADLPGGQPGGQRQLCAQQPCRLCNQAGGACCEAGAAARGGPGIGGACCEAGASRAAAGCAGAAGTAAAGAGQLPCRRGGPAGGAHTQAAALGAQQRPAQRAGPQIGHTHQPSGDCGRCSRLGARWWRRRRGWAGGRAGAVRLALPNGGDHSRAPGARGTQRCRGS